VVEEISNSMIRGEAVNSTFRTSQVVIILFWALSSKQGRFSHQQVRAMLQWTNVISLSNTYYLRAPPAITTSRSPVAPTSLIGHSIHALHSGGRTIPIIPKSFSALPFSHQYSSALLRRTHHCEKIKVSIQICQEAFIGKSAPNIHI
jgi:hypothetical protein